MVERDYRQAKEPVPDLLRLLDDLWDLGIRTSSTTEPMPEVELVPTGGLRKS